MTITYNLNIPAAANNPSVDQPNMQTNTNNIATYVAIDHVAFNTSGSGTHNQVTFANVQAPSTPSNPTAILYTKNDAAGNPQLNFINSQAIANIAASNGKVILFAGFILIWGSYSTGGDGANITFAGGGFPNNCYQVVISPIAASPVTSTIFINQGSITTTKFSTGKSGSSNFPITYIAIGN
jgi:hypothetical protein